jgi:hypothetical protein
VTLLLLALAAFTPQAQAENQFIDDYNPSTKASAYVHECVNTRLKSIALAMKEQDVEEYEIGKISIEIDDRFWNPSKYLWVDVEVITPAGTQMVRKLMQKSFLPPKACF